MGTFVRIQHKGQVTIPSRLRTRAGISEGDVVEAAFEGGRIVLTPRAVIDRSRFPAADDEYTPEQRRIIDARLAESAEDLRKGRVFGPFDTADEAIKFLHREIGSRKARSRKTPRP